MKNLEFDITPGLSLPPKTTADATTAVNGAGIDTLRYQDCLASVAVGAAAGSPTSQPVVFKVQDSPDNSAWTDVTGATVTLTADDTMDEINVPDMQLRERYLRVVATPALVAGSSPVIPIFAAILRAKKA